MVLNVLNPPSLAESLVTIGRISQGPYFELRFSQLQSTVIGRINDEIDKIDKKYDSLNAITQLQDEFNLAVVASKEAESYRFGVETNKGKLDDLNTLAGSAVDKYSQDDDDTNLTAAEVADVNTLKDQVISGIEELYVIKHPDIYDGRGVEWLKDLLTELRSYTAVTGTVDAEGTDTPTNDNRPLLDLLTDIQNRASSTATASQIVFELASELILNYSTDILGFEAEIKGITLVDAQKRLDEIEAVKAKYGDLLRAISITFATAQAFTDYIGESINPRQIAPGSVMNLFT